MKPVDVLSAGHIFDETPGAAEVDFSGGLSPAGTHFSFGNNTCAGNCHGEGHRGRRW